MVFPERFNWAGRPTLNIKGMTQYDPIRIGWKGESEVSTSAHLSVLTVDAPLPHAPVAVPSLQWWIRPPPFTLLIKATPSPLHCFLSGVQLVYLYVLKQLGRAQSHFPRAPSPSFWIVKMKTSQSHLSGVLLESHTWGGVIWPGLSLLHDGNVRMPCCFRKAPHSPLKSGHLSPPFLSLWSELSYSVLAHHWSLTQSWLRPSLPTLLSFWFHPEDQSQVSHALSFCLKNLSVGSQPRISINHAPSWENHRSFVFRLLSECVPPPLWGKQSLHLCVWFSSSFI